MGLSKGDAIQEFYSNLDWLKSAYENEGLRSATLLFRYAKSKKNFKMSYDAFRKHYNNEFDEGWRALYAKKKIERIGGDAPLRINESATTQAPELDNEKSRQHPKEEKVSWEENPSGYEDYVRRIWFVNGRRFWRFFEKDHATPYGAFHMEEEYKPKIVHDITKNMNPDDII